MHKSTDRSKLNALKHGVLARYAILPWEDENEYQILFGKLLREHEPQGATEAHLVEEIASVIWRKRRLLMAEAAVQRRGLASTSTFGSDTAAVAQVHVPDEKRGGYVSDALQGTPNDTRDLEELKRMTFVSLRTLSDAAVASYDAALATLPGQIRDEWEELISAPDHEFEDGYRPEAGINDLRSFLEEDVIPRLSRRLQHIGNRALIREQAYGDALCSQALDRVARYETHLDRKFERTLSMLIRLQNIRRGRL